jgi:heptosyltransferase-2
LPSTAVIQVKQGIGDVIWHLPFVRAIATKAGARVTLLAPPTTRAKELLQAEPCIAEVLYFEHHGSEFQRGINTLRLANLMRRRRFASIWILDRTLRPALAAWMAGIPERIGPGDGLQRRLITNRGIDPQNFSMLVMDWLRVLFGAMNVDVPSTEPDLTLPAPLVERIAERYHDAPRPWIALGLGSSNTLKDWPDESWATFLDTLRRRTKGTVFLIGGPDNTVRAHSLIERTTGARAINACALSVIEAAALLHLSDLFVGPDSGPMNLAAASGTPAFGLFGATPVLNYSRFIHAIEPDGGQSNYGMRKITPAQVMARVEPYLNVRKG